MKLLKQLLIPNTIICLIFIFFFQIFIWQRYIAARIYQRVANSGSINTPSEINEDLINFLRPAIRFNPLSSEYQSLMGKLFFAQKDYPLAQKGFITSLAIEPTNAAYHLQLGLGYIYLGEAKKAEEEFLIAEALNSSSAGLHRQLANYYLLYFGKDKMPQVSGEYQKALFLAQGKERMDILQEVYPAIIGDYQQLSGLLPEDAPFQYLFGSFLKRIKKYNEAKSVLKKAVVLSDKKGLKDIESLAYTELGGIELNLGNYDGAIAEFKQALQVMPGYGGAMRAMGWAYLWKNELTKAKALFEKSLEIDPDRGWAYYGLGQVYEKLNLRPGAIKYYKKALVLGLGDTQNEDGLREILKSLE